MDMNRKKPKLVRKLYKRGSSYETTIPRPLLFHLNEGEKAEVEFTYIRTTRKWMVEVKPRK